MDAIGVPAPEPDDAFAAIIADLDPDELVQAATAPMTSTPVPATPEAPPSAPVPSSHQEPTAAPAAPTPALAAPGPPMAAHTPPQPVRVPQVTGPTPPNYWGRHGLVAVYWIAILTGAIGQVIFFGELFDFGWPGYLAAGIIATTAETVMVSSGDTALDKRAKGRRRPQWVPFLVIAFVAAAAASGMNLSHWWDKNVSMAVIFGGIAFLGFLLHIVHGFGEGTEYIAQRTRFEQRQAEREREQRQRDIEDRRARADVPTAAPEPAAPARQPRPAPTSPAAVTRPARPTPAAGSVPPRQSTRKPAATTADKGGKVTREEVLDWALRQAEMPVPSQVLAHFGQTGRPLPTDRAVRGWLSAIKPD